MESAFSRVKSNKIRPRLGVLAEADQTPVDPLEWGDDFPAGPKLERSTSLFLITATTPPLSALPSPKFSPKISPLGMGSPKGSPQGAPPEEAEIPSTGLSRPFLPSYIPPFRYAIVEAGIYRGAYPTVRNFRFLDRLKLRTIISLVPSAPIADLEEYCTHSGIELIHRCPEPNTNPYSV